MHEKTAFKSDAGGFSLPAAYSSQTKQSDQLIVIATLIASISCAAFIVASHFI